MRQDTLNIRISVYWASDDVNKLTPLPGALYDCCARSRDHGSRDISVVTCVFQFNPRFNHRYYRLRTIYGLMYENEIICTICAFDVTVM